MKFNINNCSVTLSNHLILNQISFSVEHYPVISIIGPSGSGKTTLLRCISGLQTYTGSIMLDNVELEDIPTEQRNIGMIDQRLHLFPHLTVFENIALPLQIRKLSKLDIKTEVEKILNDFQITELRDQFPQHISGGQQQRVALARTLIYKPKLLLLDEPFASLDPITKYDIAHWIKPYITTQDRFTILVTHDIREAQYFSEYAICIIDGNIAAQGTWKDLEKNSNTQVQQLLTHHL